MKLAFDRKAGIKNCSLSLVILSLLLSVSGTNPVHGFDGSDSEIPRIEQLSLANTSAIKPNEPIAILLKTSDDKNWVKIDGTLNIGFSYRLIPGRNTPPNCATVTTTFSKLEAIEIISARTTGANARKSQTFWLVGFLPAKKDLVSNCAEYRDLTQPPVVIVNSTNFKTLTPKGSTIPIVTGGVYVPRLVDESGRFAQTTLTQRLQEFQFFPGVYNYVATYPCLTYSEGASFREKNRNALDQFEAEVKVTRDLENSEGIELSNQAIKLMRQADFWGEFAVSPTIETLKLVPTCEAPNTTSAILKTLNETRAKIKISNGLVLKSNLLKRCELFQGRYLELEKNVLAARDRYKKSTMNDPFLRFSYSSLRIDCASTSITDVVLTAREASLSQSELELSELHQRALSQVICEPLEVRLSKLSNAYRQAALKYSGSRYEKAFPATDLQGLLSACNSTPLVSEAIELMELDFDSFATIFSINLVEADQVYKSKKLRFRITCVKGSKTIILTNSTGKCLKGYKKL